MSCEGCKFYGRHPQIATQMMCGKYGNIYCQRCEHYLEEGQEEVVEVPVDRDREFIDFSPMPGEKTNATTEGTNEEKILQLEEELRRLKEAHETQGKTGDGRSEAVGEND